MFKFSIWLGLFCSCFLFCTTQKKSHEEIFERFEIEEYDVRGVIADVFTPFDKNGNITFEVIPQIMDFLYSNDVTSISVGGESAEYDALSFKEKVEVVTSYLEEAKSRDMKVIVCIPKAPWSEVKILVNIAEKYKADALLVYPGVFTKYPDIDDVISQLQMINAVAPTLPLFYYHFPEYSGIYLKTRSFYTVASAKIPNFKGIKTNFMNAAELQDIIQGDQTIYVNNYMIAPIIAAGLDSSLSKTTDIFPKAVVTIINAMEEGDLSTAVEIQVKLNKAMHIITSYGDTMPCFKLAMKLVNGIDVGSPRLSNEILKPNAERDMWDRLNALRIPMRGSLSKNISFPYW